MRFVLTENEDNGRQETVVNVGNWDSLPREGAVKGGYRRACWDPPLTLGFVVSEVYSDLRSLALSPSPTPSFPPTFHCFGHWIVELSFLHKFPETLATMQIPP